jgi:hypothetical protein
MPVSLLMVAIDWYGPFKTLAAAKLRGEQSGVEDFLYLGYQIGLGEKSYVGFRQTSGEDLLRLTMS